MRVPVVVVFLLVVTLLGASFNILMTSSLNETGPSSLSERIIVPESSTDLDLSYHLATSEEIALLCAEIRTSSVPVSTGVATNARATGLSPPSDQGWDALVGNLRIADAESIAGSMPATATSIDLSSEPFFPPVRDQGNRGTCAAWAITYYAYGYMAARTNNWMDASTGNLAHLMSPEWTYDKVCENGVGEPSAGPWDGGSWPWENADVIRVLGCPPMSVMPYNGGILAPIDFGNGSAWRGALPNHIQDNYTFSVTDDETVLAMKALLAGKTPLVINMEGHGLDNGGYNPDHDYIISSSEYYGTETNHAVCIVGYDDSIDENGDLGAFKVVNSWGSSYGLGGYFWLTYEALKKIGNESFPTYMTVDESPSVQLVAIVQADPAPDRYANITIGIGPVASPIAKVNYQFIGSIYAQLPSYMAIDISKLYEAFSAGEQDFFVNITSSNLVGNLASFRIEEYGDGFDAGPSGVSGQALGLPTTLTSPGSALVHLTYASYTAPAWGDALDASGLNLSSGGLVPWISAPYESRTGQYSVQSGTIGAMESSWLKLTVNRTGLLTFFWKVSSEVQWDTLTFRMDGELISQINGTVGWSKVSQIVQAANHTLTWTYHKDGAVTSGSDAGYIDDLLWTSGRIIGEQDFEGGASTSWTVGDLNQSNGLDYWGVEPYLDEHQGHVAWCANIGTNSGNYPGYDNTYTNYYDMGMESYLDFRLPSGKRYQYMAVDFIYHGSVLTINGEMVDYIYLEKHNSTGWSREWVMPSYSPNPNVIEIFGWTYVFLPVSNDTDEVRVMFHSGNTLWDSFGMWVDEVRVIGYSESMGESEPPTSQASGLDVFTNNTQISVSFVANDIGGSGLDYVELYCQVPGQTTYSKVTTPEVPNGRFTSSPIALTLSGGDDTYLFYTVAVDKAGNMESSPSSRDTWVRLDTEGPMVTVMVGGDPPRAYYGGAIEILLIPFDNVSGVNRTIFRMDGGAWQDYISIWESNTGAHTIEYRSLDNLGNWGSVGSTTFAIDRSPPYTVASLSGNRTSDQWYGGATVTLVALDNASGIDRTSFRIDAGPWLNYSGPVLVGTVGTHIFEYYSVDRSGNSEAVKAESVVIATASPDSVPGQVTGLNVEANGRSLTLSWTPMSGSESYWIYRGEFANAMTVIATTDDPIYTDSNVTSDKIYLYCVHASNQNGHGINSTVATGTYSVEGPTRDNGGGDQAVLIIIGALGGIALAAVAFIVIKRRR